MKIYTKGGDKGQTSLFSGKRVSKADILVDAYGTVDELNSILGVARSLHDRQDSLAERLAQIQHELFDAGADFASGSNIASRVSDEHIERYEAWIDEYTSMMPPLKNFILPSGHPVAAQLQLARTVCRRAERRAVEALDTEQIDPVLVRYLNRLADLLFVLARFANHSYDVTEEPWRR